MKFMSIVFVIMFSFVLTSNAASAKADKSIEKSKSKIETSRLAGIISGKIPAAAGAKVCCTFKCDGGKTCECRSENSCNFCNRVCNSMNSAKDISITSGIE